MATQLEGARLLLQRAVHMAGPHGTPPALETAMAKTAANLAAKFVCDEAIQLLGGYGFSPRVPGRARVPRHPRAVHRRGHGRDPAQLHRHERAAGRDARPATAGSRAGLSATRPCSHRDVPTLPLAARLPARRRAVGPPVARRAAHRRVAATARARRRSRSARRRRAGSRGAAACARRATRSRGSRRTATRSRCCTARAGGSARSRRPCTTSRARPTSSACSPPSRRRSGSVVDDLDALRPERLPGRPTPWTDARAARGACCSRRVRAAAPKGVLHTQATLAYKAALMADVHGLGPDDCVLMPAPVAHISGLLNGITLPGVVPFRTVLHGALGSRSTRSTLIERERVTFMVGPPTFFVSLMQSAGLHARAGREPAPDLERRRRRERGVRRRGRRARSARRVKRTYGSTEAPTITTSTRATRPARRDRRRAPARRSVTDPATGRAARRRPASSRCAGPRCASATSTPRRRATRSTPTAGSAPATSRRVDADGWLTIVGRLKDVIIRGGENITTAEVEQRARSPSRRAPRRRGRRSRRLDGRTGRARSSSASRPVRPRRVPRLVRAAGRRPVQDPRARRRSSTRSRCSPPASPTAPPCGAGPRLPRLLALHSRSNSQQSWRVQMTLSPASTRGRSSAARRSRW